MAKETSGERSAMWAVTTLLVVVLMLIILYFNGLYKSDGKKGFVDRNNTTPSATPEK